MAWAECYSALQPHPAPSALPLHIGAGEPGGTPLIVQERGAGGAGVFTKEGQSGEPGENGELRVPP
jgi:hypothetical protein